MSGSIFGDSDLYRRLHAVAAVLGCFVAPPARAQELARIEQRCARAATEIVAICETLCGMGVLRAVGEHEPAWALACNRSELTLEDALRCATLLQPATQAHASTARTEAAGASGIDTFLMQAVIAVDQSVLQLLRQFPLDRLGLKPAERAPAPHPNAVLQRWAGA